MNEDGTFSAMVTETEVAENAVVSLVSGASARWGHYVLSVSSADINIGTSDDKVARNYYGVKVQTSANIRQKNLRHETRQ